MFEKTEVGQKSGAFEESMKACDRIISILDDVHRLGLIRPLEQYLLCR
jgi:hypothetical protein